MGRRYGQHFLSNPGILEKIAVAACPEPVPLVIEIGPGRGALTARLLRRAERLVAVEVDPVLIAYLRHKFRDAADLEVVEADVLSVDLGQWGPAVIAGNLPYYITSPILERTFAAGPSWRGSVFLIQREVADRLVAKPGSRDYGYLSVQTQVYSRPEYLFTVGRGAFSPPPKVESAVVRLTPRDAAAEFGIENVPAFLSFVSACFRQKRKTLRNNLAARYPAERLRSLPELSARAEQLSVAELNQVFRDLEVTR